MASTIALRRVTAGSTSVLSKLLNPVRYTSAVVPSVSRFFASDTHRENQSGGGHDPGALDFQRRASSDQSLASSRRGSPFLSDWIDPFSPTRTLSQVFNLMDQLVDPLFGPSRGAGGGVTGTGGVGSRMRGWDVNEDDKALYLKMDMPGLGKEDVKVWVEGEVLVIKGEAKESEEKEGEGRKFSSRIQLPTNVYKLDEIKGEMKNGVLKLVAPKVKEEERNEVRQVQVE